MKIEDYALIGDCHSAALVGRDGSIDWLCWPRFDSGTCFAALLGDARHGRWLIGREDAGARASRRYRGHTLVLETHFETAEGSAALVDLMPPGAEAPSVVRIVEGREGCVRVQDRLEAAVRLAMADPALRGPCDHHAASRRRPRALARCRPRRRPARQLTGRRKPRAPGASRRRTP